MTTRQGATDRAIGGGADGAAQAAGRPSGHRALMTVMCACVILVFGMISAINMAVPKLSASALQPSSTEMLWVVDAYAIVFACLLIPAGAIGDRRGRKGTLMVGLGLFAAGCLLSAAAPNITILLLARAVTGAGAAFVLPNTLSLLLGVLADERKPVAIATWTAMSGLGGIIGNAISGLVLQFLPWQGLFLTVVPIALLLLLLTAKVSPRTATQDSPLDPGGSVLLAAAFVGLLYGVIEAPERGWTSVPVLVALLAAVVLFAVFVRYELRHPHPLMDPRVFAEPRLRAGALGIMMSFVAVFALFYVNAQYLQYAKGFSPLLAGLGVLPLSLGTFTTSRNSLKLTHRFGSTPVVTVGLLGTAGGLVLLALATPQTPYWLYVVYLLVFAVSTGMAVPPLSIGIISSLPASRSGLGSGINSSTRELGSAIGVAVIGTILSFQLSGHLPQSVLAKGDSVRHSTASALAAAEQVGPTEHAQVIRAFTDAMDNGFLVIAGAVLVTSVLVIMWYRKKPATAEATADGSEAPAPAPAQD
ncbi:MFS transporter [Streptomyces sp. NPDC048644]|uniref:MFS transporter n=1 Tax=Streptomyces sp. NPDC048644 TaxID=3365582 RepID=UPI003724397B